MREEEGQYWFHWEGSEQGPKRTDSLLLSMNRFVCDSALWISTAPGVCGAVPLEEGSNTGSPRRERVALDVCLPLKGSLAN